MHAQLFPRAVYKISWGSADVLYKNLNIYTHTLKEREPWRNHIGTPMKSLFTKANPACEMPLYSGMAALWLMFLLVFQSHSLLCNIRPLGLICI